MPLINCEIILFLTWPVNCFTVARTTNNLGQTDMKLYVPVVTLSTQDNAKLLQ